MGTDKNEFFKNLTLRICSSLDLNLALKKCLDYLGTVFPVEQLSMNILDDHLGAIRIVSRVTVDDSKPSSEVINLPDDFWRWFNAQCPSGPIIVDRGILSDVPPRFRHLIPNLDTNSENFKGEMVIPLVVGGVKIGVLTIFAPSGILYKNEHLELMASVREPFALALSNAATYQELVRYRDKLLDDNRFFQEELISKDKIIGEHSGLKEVMTMVGQVAGLNNTVMILGETGVGKEIIANAIHQRSQRRNGPFVKVNCGAIADTLIDAELFGYEKGAFTGAVSQRRGRFERAHGGTIFLDEVGELSPNAQVRLLRVLTNHEIERVGGSRVIPVDIRVITATHRNLAQMTAERKFREDLWFRLNVFPIHVPPLRRRKEDISAFVTHFINVKCREHGLSPPSVSPEGLERLMNYNWPGNVRELENLVERELIRLPYQDLSFDFLASATGEPTILMTADSCPGGSAPPRALDDVIREHLEQTLTYARGKISGPGGAAEILRVHPNTLRSRLDKFKISYGGVKKRFTN